MRCGSILRAATTALAVVLLAVVATPWAQAQTPTTLLNFDVKNGAVPNGLVQATNGNLYGTTTDGGTKYLGTVFKITPGGTFTTLHSFSGKDGSYPYAGLVQDTNGNLYGTTFEGGTKNAGTVFKITLSGTLTTLHSFDGTDGASPTAVLVQATNGDLYGTTERGGTNSDGTVFKITPGGTLTSLYSFGGTDGSMPYAGLVQAINGNLYGTTTEGGANGLGTVFNITLAGKLTSLHSFDGTDGSLPYAGLVQATDGNFYGTTERGGTSHDGTVFNITTGGTLTSLHSFGGTDGSAPYAGLVQATDGNLYGVTTEGGTGGCVPAGGCGTIFQITTGGSLTTLYNFDATDGSHLFTGPIQDTNGNFYGTTTYGGKYTDGTVFSLSVGLGPFVETQPTSGKVGAAVEILGTSLTGATSVSFNGKAAKFTIVSSSEITTTVPTGAMTGPVVVTTPGGTFTSNVNFRVTP
jgi:uncharacterized repeat protein (TIGR03803 family)